MRRIMNVIKTMKIIVIGVISVLGIKCGAPYIKYNSTEGLDTPITAKTKIIITCSKEKYLHKGMFKSGYISSSSICQTIEDDLISNVFIRPVETEPDILVRVDVNDVTFNYNNGIFTV